MSTAIEAVEGTNSDVDRDISLSFRAQSVYSLAAQRNGYKLFSDLTLKLNVQGHSDEESPVRDLQLRLECDHEQLEPQTWEIGMLGPEQCVRLQEQVIDLNDEYLFSLSDEVTLSFEFVLLSHVDGVRRTLDTVQITLLPANFWGGEERQPELLAAFVKPNGPYVESLVRQVADLLESNGHGRSADGYQSNTREKPYIMASALWNVISAQKLAYVSPPPSFAHKGQLIRLPRDISNTRIAACLDLSTLFASCLELMGLNTVVALTKDHAFVGVWLIDTCFPLLTNDDPLDLRKRVDARDLVLFETTLATNEVPVTFEESSAHARELIGEESADSFVYAIDIAQARARKIKPLSTIEQRQEEKVAAESQLELLTPPPPLPKVGTDERVEEATPDTRVDMWQRKLLDLSKRNSLLNFSDRARAVRVYCPDLGKLEDLLADGAMLNFQSSENSPLNDRDRSAEMFRLLTGNDLHRSYALEQLEKKTLVANMQQKKLETSLVELLRKSKNDLQEGGANTLFLALGMLRWKENARDDRSYKAPLILIPVELTRRSAKAPIKVRQIADEEPIFNLTLIEFLANEYAIDLRHFKDELPEDSLGVDVAGVWQSVRDAVVQQPGFEVIEESALASFSFAKYLMWKDLHDRLDDLKGNPFVKHLVDTPNNAYLQESGFIERHEVDDKIDPSSVFTPLNCDSSQLVAVEASGRPQDFVLEGPPGTGKSETIANIVAHNLAMGRKVLFVAEKIAALQVVYRRIEKIGLEHLCLEVHSSKANKKMVLEQLSHAVTRGSKEGAEDWERSAELLKGRRDILNAYVRALHTPSPFGLTPRQAIARWKRFENRHTLRLGWTGGLNDAPIKDKEGLESLLEVGQRLTTAYQGVSSLEVPPFQLIRAREWSNAWQSSFVHLLGQVRPAVENLQKAASALVEQFVPAPETISSSTLQAISGLARLVRIAETQPVGYVLGGDTQGKLARLAALAENKASAEERMKIVAHGATAEKILAAPIDDWLAWQTEAENSFLKRLFLKGRIVRSAKSVGFEKFSSLEVLGALTAARSALEKAKTDLPEFEELGLWKGWETESTFLHGRHLSGEEARSAIGDALSLVDNPVDLLTAMKKHLVDGWDFLDASKVVVCTAQYEETLSVFNNLCEQLAQQCVVVEEHMPIAQVADALDHVSKHSQKLKAWTNWMSAKQVASEYRLEAMAEGLENGQIPTDEAEQQLVTAFCGWLAPHLIDADEHLVGFNSIDHEKLIETFRELDTNLAETTSAYIRAVAAGYTPDINSQENAPHFSTLSRELQKKTRHKPIRQLFEEMGDRLLDLCPCMMMSPLSVAQFLPSTFKSFDLVVFDEASQITTWDAVGAIARGKNVVVVGDPKQMPPTNYFNKAVEVDNPDEEDLESILDQALAARLPHLRLLGHYRSRHETLIAFSNNKYYDNTLITYPSSDTKASAVTFHSVDGVYAKGKGRNNPIEAKAVVTEVVRRLRHPDLSKFSIGVVTLNSEQQKTIEDLLDDARRRFPDIEPYFHSSDGYDAVFVKNLESVQGDERDVIMLSVGYGPTAPGGKTMSMNFGPLNKTGGERRLNVAITRATSEVCVFASFDPAMIDLTRTSAVAVEHLKHYMEYAKHGPMVLSEQASADYGVDQFDSDFEESVAWALRDRGWKVQTQIGVSKFRVDLGIIHPEFPGVFLAGVECDGATYHGSPSARDRDRVRHAVLENLGWRLVRIWSTDYFNDPEEVIDRVHAQLEQLLEKDRSERVNTKTLSDVESIQGGFSIDWGEDELGDGEQGDASATESSENYTPDEDPVVGVNDNVLEGGAAGNVLDPKQFYEPTERPVIDRIAKEVLQAQPGITLKALTLEVAGRYGRSRTSNKQREYVLDVIKGWAGKSGPYNDQWVIWPSQDDVRDEIPWRGVSAFGETRKWNEIAVPEALGLAREALEKAPSDPVDYICEMFELQRRYDSTLAAFQEWVDLVKAKDAKE